MKIKKRHLLNHFYFIFLILILAASIYIRFKNLAGRSLWLDEAWVANAITHSNLKELINSSFHAPLFFVSAIHLIVTFFGNNELFLRLLPCLFGIGTLIIFYLIIRKHTGKMATLTSLLLLSFSYNFVHYSQELKQFSGAMFFTILLIYFCERIIAHNKMYDWIMLLLLNVIGIGFDHSIIFIITTVFIVLFISFHQKQYWKKIFVFGSIVFTFSVFFFFFHLRHQISKSLGPAQEYWLSYYPDLTSFSAFIKWLSHSTIKMFNFFSFPYFPVSLIIIIIGLFLFYERSQKRFIIYILLPIILVLAASFLQRYPYGGSRLMLFVAPLLYISFGKGLDFIINKLGRSKLYIPLLLLLVFIVVPPISNFVKMAAQPERLEELRPLLDELQEKVELGDKIYIYYGAVEAFRYYYKTKYYRMIDEKNIIWGDNHRDDINKYALDLEKILKKNMRIWIVFSHYWENERTHIIEYLNHEGKLKMDISSIGTAAYLFVIK